MLYLKSQITTFCILFEGRTGSSHLISLLDAHPCIKAYYEELVPLKASGSKSQISWIEINLQPAFFSRYKAIGFKTKLSDVVDPDEFEQCLRGLNTNIIYMYRKNRVKAVISHIRSWLLKQKMNVYNATSANRVLPPHDIELWWFD